MIRTKLMLLAMGSILMVLLISILSLSGYHVLQMKQQESNANKYLQTSAVNLNIITTDLLHKDHPQWQFEQWKEIYSSLGKTIIATQLINQITYPFILDAYRKVDHRIDAYLQAHEACKKSREKSLAYYYWIGCVLRHGLFWRNWLLKLARMNRKLVLNYKTFICGVAY